MSKQEKTSLAIADMRERVFREQGGRCHSCGLPMYGPWELAHRVPQRRWVIRTWGEGVVHHRRNLVGGDRHTVRDGSVPGRGVA